LVAVLKGLILAPLIFALGIAPALAKPTVIAELGSAPLLGTSTSTAEMRRLVARNEGMVSAAAAKIGLTPAEYAQFQTAISNSQVAWVTVPRHLDAMTWQSGGTVYALKDVVIPAGTHGWEVDLHEHGQVLALYMPAKCGNLSLVRKSVPMIAHHPVPTRVAALKVVPPPAAPIPAAAPEVAAAPAAPVPDDTPAKPVAVAAAAFPPAAAAAHPVLPFLAPLLFGLAALSGGSGSGPVQTVPVGCP
jgi:hypothetical protein